MFGPTSSHQNATLQRNRHTILGCVCVWSSTPPKKLQQMLLESPPFTLANIMQHKYSCRIWCRCLFTPRLLMFVVLPCAEIITVNAAVVTWLTDWSLSNDGKSCSKTISFFDGCMDPDARMLACGILLCMRLVAIASSSREAPQRACGTPPRIVQCYVELLRQAWWPKHQKLEHPQYLDPTLGWKTSQTEDRGMFLLWGCFAGPAGLVDGWIWGRLPAQSEAKSHQTNTWGAAQIIRLASSLWTWPSFSSTLWKWYCGSP